MESGLKNKNVPKVSYLIPCYNHEQFIYQCLESIKQDIDYSSEIILIDDGSKDRSKDVIQKWIDENPQISARLICRENRGVSKTLNELIELARGEYLRPLASDDVIIPGTTKIMLDSLTSSPGKNVIFGDVKTIDMSSRLISESHMKYLGVDRKRYKEDLKKAIVTKWAVCGPAWILSNNFQNYVGKFDDSLTVEDWNMYLRLSSVGRIKFFDGCVGLYRIHAGNTSRTTDVNKRIINLQSQMKAGVSNYAGFSGPYLLALRGQVDLLRAKISYLKKNFLATAFYLSKFAFYKVWSEIIFLFVKKNEAH